MSDIYIRLGPIPQAFSGILGPPDICCCGPRPPHRRRPSACGSLRRRSSVRRHRSWRGHMAVTQGLGQTCCGSCPAGPDRFRIWRVQPPNRGDDAGSQHCRRPSLGYIRLQSHFPSWSSFQRYRLSDATVGASRVRSSISKSEGGSAYLSSLRSVNARSRARDAFLQMRAIRNKRPTTEEKEPE